MTRAATTLMLAAILLFALAPFVVLLIAAGAPLSVLAQGTHGLELQAAVQAWSPDNLVTAGRGSDAGLLLRSLGRTVVLSLSVAAAASSLAIIGAYVATRSRLPFVKLGARVAPLLAYALPSVFLVIAAPAFLPPAPPIVQVWILHFLYLFPLAVILSVANCLTFPKSLERSAAMDGADWCGRFGMAWSAGLWSAHLGILCISALISWSDIVFSNYYLAENQKLVVDLYVLRYFEQATSLVRYDSAALFGVAISVLALLMASVVAGTLARGGARRYTPPQARGSSR